MGLPVEPRPNQPVEQQRPKQLGGATGKGFLPGCSANPRGRAVRKDRIKAEAERLASEFSRLHGRSPTAFEAAAIGGAAMLCERLGNNPPLDVEGVVKLQNSLSRALRRLGMGDIVSRTTPVSYRSYAETLADQIAAEEAAR
jgi:hypothetical protein